MLEALEAMRPLASDALLAMFQITMGEETEKAAESTLRNAGKPPAAGGGGSGGSCRWRWGGTGVVPAIAPVRDGSWGVSWKSWQACEPP